MRVLVLGAGGPAGVNTCRALAGHEVVAVDENRDHLVWCAPYATETHWLPEITPVAVNEVGADVIIPQPDNLTLWVADHAHFIAAKTFLPDRRTVALCQDKFEAGLAWRRAGLRDDEIRLIDSDPFHYRADDYPVWVRARHGAGAKAAVLARNWHEGAHWMQFWWWRDKAVEFVAEAYLPGRDLAWSGIYYRGELVCSFARERVEYLYPNLTPEGLTGTPTIARIVHDDEVSTMAEAAVNAVDGEPHGIFSVDMREDEAGIPRPTEINAGRGFTTFGLWAMEADPNLFETVCKFAIIGLGGCWIEAPLRDCLPEGLALYRHIDCGSFIYQPVA